MERLISDNMGDRRSPQNTDKLGLYVSQRLLSLLTLSANRGDRHIYVHRPPFFVLDEITKQKVFLKIK